MALSVISSLLAIAVIASALVSGVFQAFSEFVMIALHKTERKGGIEAMQILNREVFRTLFMALLIGMSILSPILIFLAWRQLQGTASYLAIAGGLIYLGAVFVVTMLGNVPLNVALDKRDHTTPETAQYWSEIFYPKWTFWNHVRTLGSGVAAVCFLFALLSLTHLSGVLL